MKKIKVADIKSKDSDGQINYLTQIMLEEGSGIFGEKKEKNKKKQVSILSKEVRDIIDDGQIDGLCISRFYENLTIEGLDEVVLKVGQRLQIGETIHEITSIGKNCFKECEIVQDEKNCNLFNNVMFASIEKGGFIKLGDWVEVID